MFNTSRISLSPFPQPLVRGFQDVQCLAVSVPATPRSGVPRCPMPRRNCRLRDGIGARRNVEHGPQLTGRASPAAHPRPRFPTRDCFSSTDLRRARFGSRRDEALRLRALLPWSWLWGEKMLGRSSSEPATVIGLAVLLLSAARVSAEECYCDRWYSTNTRTLDFPDTAAECGAGRCGSPEALRGASPASTWSACRRRIPSRHSRPRRRRRARAAAAG